MSLPSDLRDYYEKRSKGLIEARPNDSWGPETVAETEFWQQWWLPITQEFHPIDWNAGFTGRGGKVSPKRFETGTVVKYANGNPVQETEEAMERPGLVGPMDETIVMDVSPVVKEVARKNEGSTSADAEEQEGSKSPRRKRRLTDVAKDIYKRARNCCLAHIEKRGLAVGDDESDTEIVYLMGGFDRFPPPDDYDPSVHQGDLPCFLQAKGITEYRPQGRGFWLPTLDSTNGRL